MELGPSSNIVLIGMPGVGKSTVGVLLAKATGRDFLDTDVHIQARDGRPLSEIIAAEGLAGFCHVEEDCILELDCRRHVIATGGSVVYSTAAMAKLQAGGVIVHLDLSLEKVRRRLGNLTVRGVVMGPGQTLRQVYEEREPLYRAWAQITVDCDDLTQDDVTTRILQQIE